MHSAETTNVTTLGVVFVCVVCLLTLTLPRKHAYVPLLITMFWMTLGQRVVILGINFQALRIVVAMIYLRTLIRGEYKSLVFSKIDRMFLSWMSISLVAYSLQLMSVDAFINRAGMIFDSVGAFYAFRMWLRTKRDIWNLIVTASILLVPVAILMFIEKQTGRNLFAQLGGVQEFTKVRNGTIRCQGPFSHPIIAGVVGAIWVPMFLGLAWAKRSYLFAAVGTVAGLCIAYTAGSSTPFLTLLAGLIGLGTWPLRRNMKLVRRAIVLGLILLQAVMSRPIWFIFATINVLSGSTGWHRSHLIDMSVRHWYQWILVGFENVIRWGVWWGDITNHYLLEGLRGGLAAMCFFIAFIVTCFSMIGRVTAHSERHMEYQNCKLMWMLGTMLFAHVITFFSVAYYEAQSMANFYITAAAITSLYFYLEQEEQSTVADGEEQTLLGQQRLWWPQAANTAAAGAAHR
jgi:hypothetical protein